MIYFLDFFVDYFQNSCLLCSRYLPKTVLCIQTHYLQLASNTIHILHSGIPKIKIVQHCMYPIDSGLPTICKCRRMLQQYILSFGVYTTYCDSSWQYQKPLLRWRTPRTFYQAMTVRIQHSLLLLLLHLVEAIMGPLNSCIPKRRSLPPLLPSWS